MRVAIYSCAWLEHWNSGLTGPASNNRGSSNLYFHPEPSGAFPPFTRVPDQRFEIDDLAGFNATPGEEGGRLLSEEERRALLAGAGVRLVAMTR